MLNLRKLIITSSLSLAFCGSSEARVIQILHTNDLHASLQTFGAPAGSDSEYGGWAQLKSKMDQLTSAAAAQGIETIKLDAGDFTEGTSFYFPKKGSKILKAFQHLGYDAAAMGNHDWLMGARGMDAMYGENPFPFPVLSANVKIKRSLPNLKSQIVPSTQIVRSGVKFGVFGLSTDEALYKWIPEVESGKRDMLIQDYQDEVYPDDGEAGTRIVPGIANTLIHDLRRHNDMVIGLTHIGYEEDRALAANSKGVDIIVGGHSHTFLDKPTWVTDQDGRQVPVVQTGFNGKYVGKILFDVQPGQRPKFISYELVPILNQDPKDPVIDADIQDAIAARQAQFGNRMNEVIGTSDDRLVSGDAGPTAFSKFVVDAMRDITGAELAIDVGAFHGNTPQPAGPVTRLNLMEMYPRKFEADQNEGLYVYQAAVPGLLLKIGLDYAVRFGTYVATSGVTYELQKMSDSDFTKLKKEYAGTVDERIVTPYMPKNVMINGYPIQSFRWYNVAAPESLIRGAYGISALTKLVIRRGHPTPHTIWDTMNFYLLKTGNIPANVRAFGPSPWSPEIHSPRSILTDLVNTSIDGMRFAPRE